MTVLLIDDSPVMRRYVARTLEMTGLETTVYEAGNGQEGIATAFAVRPDLVITDLKMPGMSGMELVAEMRASSELRAIPILVLTADRSAPRATELMAAGAEAYLTKPVTPQSLRQCLVSLLEVPR